MRHHVTVFFLFLWSNITPLSTNDEVIKDLCGPRTLNPPTFKMKLKKSLFSKFFLLAFYFYFMYLYLELFLVFLELLWSVSMTISAWFLLVYTYIFRIIFIFFRTSVKPNWAFLWKLRYMCRSLLVFLFYKIHSLWPELWLAAATNKNESWLVNSEVCVLLKSTVIYLDVNGVRKLTINALIFFWKGAKEDPNRHF